MSKRSSALLLLIFILGLLLWAVWYMPARVVTRQVFPQTLSGTSVDLAKVEGSWHQGQAQWQWRDQKGRLNWQLLWHGWQPGVAIKLTGPGLTAKGWLSGGRQSVTLKNMKLSVPLGFLLEGQQAVSAAGRLNGQVKTLTLADGHFSALKGKLHYSGGRGQWQKQSARLPPMQIRLYMQKQTAVAKVTDNKQEQLVLARVDKNGKGTLQVFRAFARAIGESNGKGRLSDVIFSASQPVLK